MAVKGKKELIQNLLNASPGKGKKVYQNQNLAQKTKNTHSYKNQYEDRLIDMLDHKHALLKLKPILERMDKGTLDVKGAIDEMAPAAFTELMKIVYDSNTADKVKLDAVKHILGVAGFSPTQKHEVGRLDANTPRESILSIIRGSAKDLDQADIEIIDDTEETQDQD